MSSKSQRVAVLAVATALATTGAAPAASATSLTDAKPPAQSVAVVKPAAVKPPASVTGLARDLGVRTDVAWRTLDELSQSGARRARAAAPTTPSRATKTPQERPSLHPGDPQREL